MKAGRLRQRVRLEKPVKTRDGFNSPTPVWITVFEQDAEVTSINGREFFGSDRELAEVTWKIVIRAHPTEKPEPSWRAVDVDDGAVYDFVAVLPSRQRDFLTFAAKSGSTT